MGDPQQPQNWQWPQGGGQPGGQWPQTGGQPQPGGQWQQPGFQPQPGAEWQQPGAQWQQPRTSIRLAGAGWAFLYSLCLAVVTPLGPK